MVFAELYERAVSVTKTVWRRKGDDITRHEVKRMVATDVKPRTAIKTEADDAA
jgi:hypothetical protein